MLKKKILSCVLACAMVAAMGVSGFADAYPAVAQVNNDVEALNDATVFSPDTYFDEFELGLDLYMFDTYLGTVVGEGEINYSESGRWVDFTKVSLVEHTASGGNIDITPLGLSGNGTSVATAEYMVDAPNHQTRYVRITAYYNGNVTIGTF